MSKKYKKYYAIKRGYKVGIFHNYWNNVKKYTEHFPHAVFKGFNTLEKAEEYYYNTVKNRTTKNTNGNNIMKENKIVDKEKRSIQREIRRKEREEKRLKLEEVQNRKKSIVESIIFNNSNEKHSAMQTVSIVVIGHHLPYVENTPGYYEYLLIDNKSGKHIKKKSDYFSDISSANRVIIMGLIDGVSQLKKPCHIKAYIKTMIGFKKMIKESQSPNADKLSELKDILLNNGHVIEELLDVKKADELWEKYK